MRGWDVVLLLHMSESFAIIVLEKVNVTVRMCHGLKQLGFVVEAQSKLVPLAGNESHVVHGEVSGTFKEAQSIRQPRKPSTTSTLTCMADGFPYILLLPKYLTEDKLIAQITPPILLNFICAAFQNRSQV